MATKQKVAKSKTTSTGNASSTVASDTAKVKEAAPVVRRKELVARIAESSGLKPNAIKSALDATMAEIGNALSNGETVNIPPLGKIMVNRSRETENAEIIVCKIRRSKAKMNATEPTATAAE